MVGDAAPLRKRELGGADVHAPVELHRVGVDDLAVESLGQVEAEVGLARGCGSDDGDDRRSPPTRPPRGAQPTVSRIPLRALRGPWAWPWSCSSSSCPNGSRVDPGQPRVARLAPPVALDRLAGLLRLALVEPVDVEGAVEVVVLVLHASGEPPGGVELDPEPSRSTPTTWAWSARLSGKASPGTDRQPSVSSSGLGRSCGILEVVTVGLMTWPCSGTPSSLAICQMKTRSPTPICGAARPTPLAATLVSYMS